MAAAMIPPETAPAFLERAGWGGAAVLPLAGDASFRRYFRVVLDGRTAVLMDAPPAHEDARPFLAVAAHLRGLDFRAPEVLAENLAEGLVLLEDFGDRRMAEAVAADPGGEERVYRRAVDLLRDLHRHPAPADLPPYDEPAYQRETGLFVEWYAPAVGLAVDEAGYSAAWGEVLARLGASRDGDRGDVPVSPHPVRAELVEALPSPTPASEKESNPSTSSGRTGEQARNSPRHHPVTVLRDYHAENIMLLHDDALGLLDFQDALAGHPAYDLVSLLQDARRDVGEALESAMLHHYGPVDRAAYAVLGAQRNAKILGIFTRLWKRDGKPRYLAYQPRVWRYLERDLMHPALAPVRDWFDANVPAAARASAWEHLPA